jgi:hypothetical protein
MRESNKKKKAPLALPTLLREQAKRSAPTPALFLAPASPTTMPPHIPGMVDPLAGIPPALEVKGGSGGGEADTLRPVVFVAVTDAFDAPHSGGPKKLAVVGELAELGGWSLGGSLPLEQVRREGERREGGWRPICMTASSLPSKKRPGRPRPGPGPPFQRHTLKERGAARVAEGMRMSRRWRVGLGAGSRKTESADTPWTPSSRARPHPLVVSSLLTSFFFFTAGDDLVWESAAVLIPASK